MNGLELLGAFVGFIGLWGSLWYRLGRLTGEVKEHNTMLARIERQLEHIITTGGIKHG